MRSIYSDLSWCTYVEPGRTSSFGIFESACVTMVDGLNIAAKYHDKHAYQEGWMEVTSEVLSLRPHPGKSHPRNIPWFVLTDSECKRLIRSVCPVVKAFVAYMHAVYPGFKKHKYKRYRETFPAFIADAFGGCLYDGLDYETAAHDLVLAFSNITRDQNIFRDDVFACLYRICEAEDEPDNPMMIEGEEPREEVKSIAKDKREFQRDLQAMYATMRQMVNDKSDFFSASFDAYSKAVQCYFMTRAEACTRKGKYLLDNALLFTDQMAANIRAALLMTPPKSRLAYQDERLESIERLFLSIRTGAEKYLNELDDVPSLCPFVHHLEEVIELFDICGCLIGALNGLPSYADDVIELIANMAKVKGRCKRIGIESLLPNEGDYGTIVFCEGDPKGRKSNAFDARVFKRVFENEFPNTLFFSLGSCTEVLKPRNYVVAVAQSRWPKARIIRVIDRDDRSDADIEDARLDMPELRALSLRNIESYFLTEEILRKYCVSEEEADCVDAVMKELQKALDDSISRGNPSDDYKRAANDFYVGLRRCLRLTQTGNDVHSFMFNKLVPLMTSETKIYGRLRADIFAT